MADQDKNEMPAEGVSRREIFHILGSAPALAAITAGVASGQMHDHAAMASAVPAPTGPYQRKVFDEHQWQTVQRQRLAGWSARVH